MKNIYIRPTMLLIRISNESLLTGSEDGQIDSGFSKKHDFTDDSFDNIAWPKDKSPWED